MMIEPTGPAGYPANIIAAIILIGLGIVIFVNWQQKPSDDIGNAAPCLLLGGGKDCFQGQP